MSLSTRNHETVCFVILLTFAYFFPLAGNSTKAYYWLKKESRNKLFRDLGKLRLKVEELFRDSGIINNLINK